MEDATEDRAVLDDVELKTIIRIVDADAAIADDKGESVVELVAETAEEIPVDLRRNAEAADHRPAGEIPGRRALQAALHADHRIDPVFVAARAQPVADPGGDLDVARDAPDA